MRSGTAFLFALALALAAVSVAAGQPNAHNADKVSYFDDRRDYIPDCDGTLELNYDILERTLYPEDYGRCKKIDSKYRNGSLYGKTGIVATVEGNCCWKVYSRRGCRGRVKVLRLGEVEVLEGMTVKTAKAKEC